MSPTTPSRRQFIQSLGTGLLISITLPTPAQEAPRRRNGNPGRGNPAVAIASRLHIGADGSITVMTAKVECGQGARAQLTQAAAEELRVSPDRVTLIMADTDLCPAADGMTAGSRTTPSTVPAVRAGCAAARDALITLAAAHWSVDRATLTARDGRVTETTGTRTITYADLAANPDATKAFTQTPANVTVTPVAEWSVLGQPLPRPNGRDLVTGKHHYPSDIQRPGMLYGAVVRPPAHGAKLLRIDESADSMPDGQHIIKDGDFTGVVAPTRFAAEWTAADLRKKYTWSPGTFPCSSDTLYDYLSENARNKDEGNAADGNTVKATYHVAYIQHAPLEPRAAVAEWSADKQKLTVWTATQNPFGVRSELAAAFSLKPEAVHVIVPDFGGGFGGKHSGECAVEAARLAHVSGKPVSLRWTREEEFNHAYFRPAGVIEASATLDDQGRLAKWNFININSGQQAIEPSYRVGANRSRHVPSKPPLRHGSYRGLASTANTFARESFIDECAAAAKQDPLAFRLAHLEDPRLRAVLEAAAKSFDWPQHRAHSAPNTGVGLACGIEKGSFVAACARVAVDPAKGAIKVLKVTQAYECGKVINPPNLKAQNAGAIMMGLGAALREEVRFTQAGEIQTASFSEYKVPRLADLPDIDIVLLDRPDLPSLGAGETPIIAIAPAIANAVHHATAHRLRSMPLKFPKTA